MSQTIPRNLEALLKKAAIDPAFKGILLEKRSRLAEELSLPLDPAEKQMLDGMPANQLQAIISQTKVSPEEEKALGGSSYLTLGALAVGGALAVFIAALVSSGNSVSSPFGKISGTLGHRIGTVVIADPDPQPPALKHALNEEIQGLSFAKAIEKMTLATGITIGLHENSTVTIPDVPLQTSSRGKSVAGALFEICQEVGRSTRAQFSLMYPTDNRGAIEVRILFQPLK